MDASKIQPRQEALVSPATARRINNADNSEPAIETRPDNNQDDGLKVSKETVNLSDTSLKLSSSSPVKSSDQSAPIENQDQAQQALSRLLADMQSNPSQAQGAHSNVFSGAVESLLG